MVSTCGWQCCQPQPVALQHSGGAETDRRVAARSARQQALLGATRIPRIHVVLDESALRRQVGGPGVTRRQMAALAEAAQRPEVTLQVLPFTAGACAGIDGDFVILAFPDPEDPPVVYAEGLLADLAEDAR